MASVAATRTETRRTRSRRSAASPAESSVDGLAAFCALLRLEDGSRFELHDFQRTMLADYFAGTTETLVLISKKNGKSTLLAALALHHLLTTADAECVIAAAARDQAQILLGQAQGFIRRSPGLEQRLQVKQREIVRRDGGGRIRVMASDENTADGVIPTLALVDELHRHKSADMYGVFRDGLGPRGGRLITISTAGDDPDTPLGRLRDAARALPHVERDGAYRYCRSADGAFVMHEWALDPDADRSDMRLVKQANPAPWQTVQALERRHSSPSMTEWQWARFACGVWLMGEDSWLPDGAWQACMEEGCQIPELADVTLGVDLGRKHDRSAIAVCHRRDDERVVVEAHVLQQGAPLAEVEAKIRWLAGRYRIESVTFDPWSFARSAEILSDEGLLMIEHPQSPERMHKASAALYEAILTRRIVHNGDPTLTSHVLAGATKDTPRGWTLVKNPNAKRPIDALVALAMAFTEIDEGGSMYDDPEVTV